MKDYEIVIGSPINYEELTAEIVMNGEYIALVQKEEGNDKMIIEFYAKKLKTKIYIDNFISALEDAKALLSK